MMKHIDKIKTPKKSQLQHIQDIIRHDRNYIISDGCNIRYPIIIINICIYIYTAYRVCLQILYVLPTKNTSIYIIIYSKNTLQHTITILFYSNSWKSMLETSQKELWTRLYIYRSTPDPGCNRRHPGSLYFVPLPKCCFSFKLYTLNYLHSITWLYIGCSWIFTTQ